MGVKVVWGLLAVAEVVCAVIKAGQGQWLAAALLAILALGSVSKVVA